jgi:hypothetical protein
MMRGIRSAAARPLRSARSLATARVMPKLFTPGAPRAAVLH